MKYLQIKNPLFIKNRQMFTSKISSNTLAIFNSNDVDLFNQFTEDNRTLHFMSHGITAISEPIFQSLGDRLIFCRLTRCPTSIYMLNHLANWSKRWGKESRNGMICNDVNGYKNYPL